MGSKCYVLTFSRRSHRQRHQALRHSLTYLSSWGAHRASDERTAADLEPVGTSALKASAVGIANPASGYTQVSIAAGGRNQSDPNFPLVWRSRRRRVV
jgi:hypothetical protein